MRILYSLLFLCSYLNISAQIPECFRDDFDSNDKKWYVGESADADYTIKDGHYILSNKNNLGNIYWGFKNIYMDPKWKNEFLLYEPI